MSFKPKKIKKILHDITLTYDSGLGFVFIINQSSFDTINFIEFHVLKEKFHLSDKNHIFYVISMIEKCFIDNNLHSYFNCSIDRDFIHKTFDIVINSEKVIKIPEQSVEYLRYYFKQIIKIIEGMNIES